MNHIEQSVIQEIIKEASTEYGRNSATRINHRSAAAYQAHKVMEYILQCDRAARPALGPDSPGFLREDPEAVWRLPE